jgi:diketogulonate reductase-like aldo/keto reductase
MAAKSDRTVTLPSGKTVAALGQGTWHMGEDARRRKDEVAALRAGIDLGMTLIDTAEMYASGGAEEVTAEAISGRRDDVFVVSKVLPENATLRGTVAACERSLKRLATDRIDLYLLHWRGSPPLKGTLEAFDELMRAGKIGAWGVSNFDKSDMEELWDLPGGKACATNQVLYNLSRRGIEHDLLPWCAKRHVSIMAYSPVEQGRLLRHRELQEVAKRHNATPAQVAIAWTMRHDGVISIPKAGTVAHVKEDFGALDVRLTAEDFTALDKAFPPPRGAKPLEML